MDPFILSKEHITAVHRKRNIRHMNPFADLESPLIFESTEDIVNAVFYNDFTEDLDFETLCWDFADGGCGSVLYESNLLPMMNIVGKEKERVDIRKAIRLLMDRTRERKAEVFWNHRMNGPEFNPGSAKYEVINEMKKAHPDWVIRNWWWQGFWNYESEELRKFKLSVLEEILMTYDLDGLQLDFLRDIPLLPPGRQWALRDCITQFVYDVRKMTQDMEKVNGRPILLAVRVPENLNGCRMDGLEVKRWSELNLVDIYVLGGRTVNVDIGFFQEITKGKSVRIYPCLDGSHPILGYYMPSEEYLNGTFFNWLEKGADGVEIFDWGIVTQDKYEQNLHKFLERQILSREQIHALKNLKGGLFDKPKLYAMDRKGGYPWATGYGCRNDFAFLPEFLGDKETDLNIEINGGAKDMKYQAVLRVVFSGSYEGDEIQASFNNAPLELLDINHKHQDPQVLPYTPPSNCYELYKKEHTRRLSVYQWLVPVSFVKTGVNTVTLQCMKHVSDKKIVIEKLEVYHPGKDQGEGHE